MIWLKHKKGGGFGAVGEDWSPDLNAPYHWDTTAWTPLWLTIVDCNTHFAWEVTSSRSTSVVTSVVTHVVTYRFSLHRRSITKATSTTCSCVSANTLIMIPFEGHISPARCSDVKQVSCVASLELVTSPKVFWFYLYGLPWGLMICVLAE